MHKASEAVLLHPQRKTIFNTKFSLLRGFMPTYKNSMQIKASKILKLLTQSEDDFSKGKSTSQKDLFDSLEKELKPRQSFGCC